MELETVDRVLVTVPLRVLGRMRLDPVWHGVVGLGLM